MNKTISLSLISVACLVLSGCQGFDSSFLDPDTPTMQEIYENHQHSTVPVSTTIIEEHIQAEESKFQQMVTEIIDLMFPTLDNPMLVMYVYPHINEELGVPVPGFWTAISMYETVEFALPGEVVEIEEDD